MKTRNRATKMWLTLMSDYDPAKLHSVLIGWKVYQISQVPLDFMKCPHLVQEFQQLEETAQTSSRRQDQLNMSEQEHFDNSTDARLENFNNGQPISNMRQWSEFIQEGFGTAKMKMINQMRERFPNLTNFGIRMDSAELRPIGWSKCKNTRGEEFYSAVEWEANFIFIANNHEMQYSLSVNNPKDLSVQNNGPTEIHVGYTLRVPGEINITGHVFINNDADKWTYPSRSLVKEFGVPDIKNARRSRVFNVLDRSETLKYNRLKLAPLKSE